ncbi:hypothetical protein BDD12DRAFT_885405 [Trichophaea hybrida]|nr:hypothetical protein BDD12DRAFT_885405 [Trichophaea hybrida]
MEPQVDDWQPNDMNPVPGTEPDAELMKIANPFQRGPRYGSLIYFTTKAWDRYLLHLFESIGSLRRQTSQTQKSRGKRKLFEQAVGESSFTILTTLMLRWTMNANWSPTLKPQDSITGETADDDRHPLVPNAGKKLIKRFQPRWRFIPIIALAPVLGPATMFPENSRAQMLWESNKSDNGRPNMTKVAEIIKMFATDFPWQIDWIPSANQVKNMNHALFEAAMRYGTPKLAWFKNWLRKNMPLGKNNQNNGKKVILWVFWPITQWLIKHSDILTSVTDIAWYCRVLGDDCFAIHSTMGADVGTSIKEKFIQKDGVRVLVLSYMTSNEGLNLHYNCQNSIMLEQGVNYAMEYQAWSRVRQIGQKYTLYTHRLVNMTTID